MPSLLEGIMYLSQIEEAIEALKSEELTAESAYKLAALYIIRDNISTNNHSYSQEGDETSLLPYYSKYSNAKRRYQLNLTTESEVLCTIKFACKELSDFIDTIYSNTDMNKERICIKSTIRALYEKYCD